jgi:hypothetical protein
VYVKSDWISANKLNIEGGAEQTILNEGVSGSVSDTNGEAVIVTEGSASAVKFTIIVADTIAAGAGGWFVNTTKHVAPPSKPADKFQSSDTIELYRIKSGEKYLTVLDTIQFTSEKQLKNTLGWDTSHQANPAKYAFQLFAVVRNVDNDGLTFLPAARPENGSVLYNTKLGKFETGKPLSDLSKVWRINSQSEGAATKLVVADTSGIDPILFRLSSGYTEWTNEEGYEYVAVKNARTGKYYLWDAGESGTSAEDLTNNIKTHWSIKEVQTNAGTRWKFTPTVERKDVAVTDPFKTELEVLINKEKEILLRTGKGADSSVTIEAVYPDKFNLFRGDLASKQVTLEAAGKYLSYARSDTNSVQKVGYDFIEEPLPVSIKKIGGEWLNKESELYPITYYVFSYTANGKEYFLHAEGTKPESAGKDSIKWINLPKLQADALKAEAGLQIKAYEPFQFSLPRARGAAEKIYLLSRTHGIVEITGDAASLTAVKRGTDDIYGAVDALLAGTTALPWTLGGSTAGTKWVYIPSITVAGEERAGLLQSVAENNSKWVKWETNYGYLSASGISEADTFIFKQLALPGETVDVAEDAATGLSETTVTFNIIKNGSYLTSTGEFGSLPSTFEFEQIAGDAGFTIVDVDSRQYLTIVGEKSRLEFTEEEDVAVKFNLTLFSEGTGIKGVGVSSAKIYGVAGGVKVTGASGAVAVYTVDGRLITKQSVSRSQTIAVPAGIYIVKNGVSVTKVIVK